MKRIFCFNNYIQRSRRDTIRRFRGARIKGGKRHRSLRESREVTPSEKLVDAPKVLALCPSTPEPIPRENSRECPHGNFRFPRSGRLYGSFRGAPSTRKFSYVPFTRRVRRVSPSRSRSLVPRTRLCARRLFLSI